MIDMLEGEGERERERKKKKNGDAGHRSRCLSHAKRALYRVSYIPAIVTNRISVYLLHLITYLEDRCIQDETEEKF